MNIAKKSGRKLLRWLTPLPMMIDAGKSVAKSAVNISQAAAAAAASKQRKEEGRSEGEKKWLALTPEERFAKAYADGEWTEEGLARQAGAIRVAKFVFLAVGLLLIPAILSAFLFAPWWMAIFMAPAFSFFAVLMFVQALRHSWWDCQLAERQLMTFKEFLSRRDLWSYFLT